MRKLFLTILASVVAAITMPAMTQKTAYGYTMNPATSPKLVSFTTDNPSTVSYIGTSSLDPRSGAAVKNTLYLLGMDDDYNVWFYSVNIENGDVTKIKKLGDVTCPADLSYDYAGDKMYYIANSENADSRSAVGTIDLTTGKRTSIKDNIGYYAKAIAVDAEGQVFAFSNAGELLKVDKSTGNATVVGSTGITVNGYWNFQSMDFDRATGTLYMAAWESGDKCTLYTIDTTTGAATSIGAIGGGNGIHTIALTIPYVPSDDAAPKKVDNLAVAADATGALSATVTWTNPTLDNLEKELTSLTKVEVLRGDDVVKTFNDVTAGQEMTYTDAVDAAGMYKYTVRAYNAVGPSADQFVEAWVGHDVPAAVGSPLASLNQTALMKNDLSWEAPSVGAHGGYIDASSLKYDVIRVNDNNTVATDLTATSYTDASLLDELTRYTYQIVAKNNDGEGETASTNDLVNGPGQKPEPTWTADFSTWNGGGQYWTIIDGNGDNYPFVWYNDYMNMFGLGENHGYYIYQKSETLYGYDFIVSPPLVFTEGHDYMISATVTNDDIAGYREESFRFYTMAGYTLTGAMPLGDESFTVKHPGEFKTYGYLFQAADDGYGAADEEFTSFIALCCDSKYDMGMLVVSEITVEDLTAVGINEVKTSATDAETPTYNLSGQRVSPNTKGIVIRNGKKYINR